MRQFVYAEDMEAVPTGRRVSPDHKAARRDGGAGFVEAGNMPLVADGTERRVQVTGGDANTVPLCRLFEVLHEAHG